MHALHGSRRFVLAALALATLAAAVLAAPQTARADPSDGLRGVLGQVRSLSSFDFTSLVGWSRNGTSPPFAPWIQPGRVEGDILNLGGDDRNAMLSWLQGRGRGALYAQGASDADIGPPQPALEGGGSAPPTPNPWRMIPLATATLDGDTQGKIQIVGGFAAVKRDGSSAIVCVSFKNVDARTANEILFQFPLFGGGGDQLGQLELDRTGEFSPNIDIATFDSMSSWQSNGIGPTRSFLDNCVRRDLPTAALPLLQARTVGYKIARVGYTDGSSWSPAGAVPIR